MLAWFSDDAECRDYLEWLRWPDGFVCPHCRSEQDWRTSRGDWSCGGCTRRVSVTSGTVFDKTRTPLTTWFATAWYMTNKKTAAVSTKGLQRVLELGSYQTAWTMLHKYRSAMVCPGRELLSGDVEVDETLVVVAVEVFSPKGGPVKKSV